MDEDNNGLAGVKVKYGNLMITTYGAVNFTLLDLPAGKITLGFNATVVDPLYPLRHFGG